MRDGAHTGVCNIDKFSRHVTSYLSSMENSIACIWRKSKSITNWASSNKINHAKEFTQ